jgi:hypothetical protein
MGKDDIKICCIVNMVSKISEGQEGPIIMHDLHLFSFVRCCLLQYLAIILTNIDKY